MGIRHIEDYAHWLAGPNILSTLNQVKTYNQTQCTSQISLNLQLLLPTCLLVFERQHGNFNVLWIKFFEWRDLEFCYFYTDDILVYSTGVTHQSYLQLLFELLTQNGILLNEAKCTLGQKEVAFLGHYTPLLQKKLGLWRTKCKPYRNFHHIRLQKAYADF